MGLFDGIVGSVVGGLLGMAGEERAADMQYENQSALQKQAYEYQKESMQNRHQWEVDDLKAAGLNPILSATNSAGGTINVGAGQAAKPDFSHAISQMMNAFSNSALVQNSMEVNKQNADSNELKAEADWLRATLEEQRNPSSIALQQNQAFYYNTLAYQVDELVPLQKAFQQASIDEKQQNIINGIMMVSSQMALNEKYGEAALMNASAAQLNAYANWNSSEAQQIIAKVSQEVGVSKIDLQNALEGKYDAETKESIERYRAQLNKNAVYEFKNDVQIHGHLTNDSAASMMYFASDLLGNFIPIKLNLGD